MASGLDRDELGLAARQGIVMAELSGMVARPAKSPGETSALLTEMDRKMKLVEDVTGRKSARCTCGHHGWGSWIP